MGANARIARIIYADDISEGFRYRVARRFGTKHWFTRMINCPWCCGFHTSWLLVTPWAWFPVAGLRWWWLFPLAVLAVSHAGGRLNHHHGPTAARS